MVVGQRRIHTPVLRPTDKRARGDARSHHCLWAKRQTTAKFGSRELVSARLANQMRGHPIHSGAASGENRDLRRDR